MTCGLKRSTWRFLPGLDMWDIKTTTVHIVPAQTRFFLVRGNSDTRRALAGSRVRRVCKQVCKNDLAQNTLPPSTVAWKLLKDARWAKTAMLALFSTFKLNWLI